MTTFEFVIPTAAAITMTVEASSLCAAYVLVHRSLERLRPHLGNAAVDGLPMLLLAPLRPAVVIS